jgi:hypothetical protein
MANEIILGQALDALNTNKIINLPNGTAPGDSVNFSQLSALVGGVTFIGPYNATTNAPDLVTPAPGTILKGYMYKVTVGGSAFYGEVLEPGDSLIANVDNPASLSDWTLIQVNIDPYDEIIVVDDLAAAQALTGLRVGNIVYVKNTGGGLNPFRVIVYDVSGGTTWAAAEKTYFSYEAGGRAVKNESTANLTTTFGLGNNVPIPLRTRTGGTGAQQLLNMNVVLEDDTQFLRINDPLQFGRASDDPKFNYEYTATFSVSSSNASSIYEFHFVQKTGGVASVLIDSIRWEPSASNTVTTLSMSFQTNRAFNEKVGVYVERTQNNGALTLERFSLVGKYIGQRGYY